jgi:hypothetical protein
VLLRLLGLWIRIDTQEVGLDLNDSLFFSRRLENCIVVEVEAEGLWTLGVVISRS